MESGHYREDWHLDKDLLFKGNKVYSPETCVFIPREINLSLSLERDGKQFGYSVYRDKFQTRCSNADSLVEFFSGTKGDCMAWYMNKKKACLLTKAERFKGDLEPKAFNALINYANSLVQSDR